MTPHKFNKCIQQIRNGDSNGLIHIYEEYYNRMIIVARQILKEKSMAEDMASKGLQKILENAWKYDYIKTPDAWITTLVKNETKDYLKANFKHLYMDMETTTFAGPDRNIDTKIDLDNAVAKLSKIEQEIYVRCFVLRYKCREISAELNLPESTIKWRISSIRQKLIDYLDL